MHRPLLLVAIFFLTALPAATQDLLPPSFSSLSAAAATTSVRGDAVEQIGVSEAGILREYGLVAAERRPYSRDSQTLTITLYRMRDPTGAYGAYTYMVTEPMPVANLAQYSSISRQRALVVVGNLLVEATGRDVPALAPDLKALVAQLALRADGTPFPPLAQYLPERGRLASSERYLAGPMALQRLIPLGNGDWLGFADGVEAQLARYRVNGQEATLLVAAFPTPQAAARKLEELGRWFVVNPERDTPPNSPAPLFARRKGPLLTLVAYTKSRALATALLDQVHYETQVTWNEPSFRLTDPNIGQVIIGTIIGTGIILLFALVVGISFGGVRLVVKYFFPGKVFDRAPHIEIIQLGLTSKPIEAKDFY